MAFLGSSTQDTTLSPSSKGKRNRLCDASSTNSASSLSSHPHPYKRAGHAPSHSFRPPTTDQPQAVCVVCLRRPHPNMGECREETLSDRDPAFSTRSKLGHLVDRQGKTLCVDFQLS